MEPVECLSDHPGEYAERRDFRSQCKGKRIDTRAIHSIDTDIKLNRALWVMAETMLESLR